MNAERTRLYTSAGMICLSAILMTFSGCSEKDPGYDIVELEGKVEKIETHADGTGKITVEYYNEKQEQNMLGTGLVNQQTEIMINGVASKLADVRQGDHVRGEVRIDKKGDNRVQTAVKITIDRPKPVGED